MATVEEQNEIFRKHLIERVELSIHHAQEWVDYFKLVGDISNAKHWENTLKHRLKLVMQHTQNDFQDREYRIENDS